MFFSEKIKSIKENDKVLEIGPGSFPHKRSDIFLELKFESEDQALSHRGFAEKLSINKPIIYYDGNEFPFENNEFDYVICSHVLEHVPVDKIDLFLSEMQRVAPMGYIEFPRLFYEFTRGPQVHLTCLNIRDNNILICDKNNYKDSYINKLIRNFINHYDPHAKIYEEYKDFFFIGFEWNKNDLNYKFVDNIDELINEKEFNEFVQYFANKPHKIENNCNFEQLCQEKFRHKPLKFLFNCLKGIIK